MDRQREMQRGKGERNLSVIPDEEKVVKLAAKVFGNHLLRETILSYCIHQDCVTLDRSTICTLRAVSGDWNDSVCKLLHKNGEPLFEISLGDETTLNEVLRNENISELLKQLTNTFACSTQLLGRSPTISLILYPESFEKENHQSFYNFLVGCGPGLVRIEMDFSLSGGSMEGIFPNLSLPSLQKVVIGFDDAGLTARRSSKLVDLLQSILSGATALKELEACQIRYTTQPYKSSIFENIFLPPTLERMEFGIGSVDMECLLSMNYLPNLTSFELSISGNSMAVGSLSRIFEKVRGTLKKLTLCSDPKGPPTTLLGFPVMEKLESLELNDNRWYELKPGIRSLEKYLPKLRLVHFSNLTSDMLVRWTNGSKFSSVDKLILESAYRNEVFDPDCIGRIHLAFPNVVKLELRFRETPVAGLQQIFTQMTNLENLKIIVRDSADLQVEIDWDSLLIGTSVDLAAGLRAQLSVWEELQINDERPSIRKLSELRNLSLQDATYGLRPVHFITDLTFHFALLKMPQLQNLSFSKNFTVSQEMADKWRASDRFLKYTRFYQRD